MCVPSPVFGPTRLHQALSGGKSEGADPVASEALGLVEHAAFIEPGIRAAPRGDLPDDLTIFMLFMLLDTGVSHVCIHRVLFAVQQLGDLRDIGHIGGSAMHMMNQSRLGIGADMRLHSEEVLATFFGLMHLGIELSFLVIGRAGSMNDGGVDMVPWRSDRPFSCR